MIGNEAQADQRQNAAEGFNRLVLKIAAQANVEISLKRLLTVPANGNEVLELV